MPTRADWEAASPKCPQMVPRSGRTSGRLAAGAAAMPCASPLTITTNPASGALEWACPTHGVVAAANLVAAQRAAAELPRAA